MKRICLSLLVFLFCLTSLFSAVYQSSVSSEGVLQIVTKSSAEKETSAVKEEEKPLVINTQKKTPEVVVKAETATQKKDTSTDVKKHNYQFVEEGRVNTETVDSVSISSEEELEKKLAEYENTLNAYDSTVKELEDQISRIKASLSEFPDAFSSFEDSMNENIDTKIDAIPEPVNPFLKKGIFFDMYANATLVRQKDPAFGISLNFGYRDRINLYSLYGRFDYFMVPLGSKTGRLGTIEFNAEAGVNFSFVISAQDWQETKLSIDIGNYSKWFERSGHSSVFFLGYNGLMLRPGISTKANLVIFKVELGLYYQVATYPRYSDYDGFGIYLKIF